MQSESVWQGCVGRIGEDDQFSDRILFVRQRNLGFGIENAEHGSAVNAPQEQAVAFNTDNSIFLVEHRHE